MTYVDDRAEVIRSKVDAAELPDGDVHDLFRIYAVLSFAKGMAVTASDVHDAWSAWASDRMPSHGAIVPFAELDHDTASKDEVFVRAIRDAVGGDDLDSRLFPTGLPARDPGQLMDLFKAMLETSEALVSRRQSVNTFFLTAVGVLITALGWMLGGQADALARQIGMILVGVTGLAFSISWHSLLVSFGQLNRGKFRVINRLERELAAAPFDAEWFALKEGRDPKVYRSFTSSEVWVPRASGVMFALLAVGGALWCFAPHLLGVIAKT